jgi:Zn-dependent M28 family amino/carboxypeptidase
MVGSINPGRFVYDSDGSHTEWSTDYPDEAAAIEDAFVSWYDSEDLPSLPTPLDGRSDYLGFVTSGIPSGGVFTGAIEPMTQEAADLFGGIALDSYDPCYHQACDTVENVDLPMLVESTRAAHQVLDQLRADAR